MLALVDKHLKEYIQTGKIRHVDDVNLLETVQPASLDLPIGSHVYHLEHKFLPFSTSIQERIDTLATDKISTKNGTVLYKGQTYLIPCLKVDIDENIFGKVSPKSSLGRIDVLIRAVFDNTGIYDTILSGSKGMLWLEVTPQSFNIKINPGNSLTQLMLFEKSDGDNGNSGNIKYKEQKEITKNIDFLFDESGPIKPKFYENNMMIGLGVGNFDTIGYKARHTNKIIDLNNISHYDREDFFEPIYLAENTKGEGKKVVLEQGRFYILPTKEKVRVPEEYSIELIPFTHLMGELRVHYAGFFDPGFGGNRGATAVLEIRPHEDTIIVDGQPICMVKTYINKENPTAPYGSAGNNYQGQEGPKLAKFFK